MVRYRMVIVAIVRELAVEVLVEEDLAGTSTDPTMGVLSRLMGLPLLIARRDIKMLSRRDQLCCRSDESDAYARAMKLILSTRLKQARW